MKNIHNQSLSLYGMCVCVCVCVCEKERENVYVGIYVVETLEIYVSEHWLWSGGMEDILIPGSRKKEMYIKNIFTNNKTY